MGRETTLQRKRQFWSDEEDARLVRLVEVYGIHSWPEVAAGLHGRDSKSCSLRWRYFLAPHIIRTTDQKLSDWEVAVLFWTQREHGNKWRLIVDDFLPWRSPNDLKNYCNQYISSKGSQIVSHNKLLLQGMTLQALLASPPPEVQERWENFKLMQQGLSHNEQRPAKKGTRGLSYILRQAAKQSQSRYQPYNKAPPPPSHVSVPAPAPAAAAALNHLQHSSQRRQSLQPAIDFDGAPFGAAAAAAVGQQQQQQQHSTYVPRSQAALYMAAHMAGPVTAPGLAVGGLFAPLPYSSAQQPVPGPVAQMPTSTGYGTQQPALYCVPAAAAASEGMSFAPPAQLQLPVGNYNGSMGAYDSPSHMSSTFTTSSAHQSAAECCWGNGSFTSQMSGATSVAQVAAAAGTAAACGAGISATASQLCLPPSWTHAADTGGSAGSWSPADEAAAAAGAAGGGSDSAALCTPSSVTSCCTPTGLPRLAMNMNLNMDLAAPMHSKDMPCMAGGYLPPTTTQMGGADGCLPAAGGAFGYQGRSGSSSSSFTTCPQLQRGALGGCSFSTGQQQHQQLDGTSISSNGSSTFSLDPAGFHSPTNQQQSFAQLQTTSTVMGPPQQQHQQHQQQQQAPAGVAVISAHMMLPSVLPQQLLPPHFFLQQHQQGQQTALQYQQVTAVTFEHSHHQQQEQEQQHLEVPTRSSGTGGTAAAAAAAAAAATAAAAAAAKAAAAAATTTAPIDDLALLLDLDASVDDFDAADIADLLSGEEHSEDDGPDSQPTSCDYTGQRHHKAHRDTCTNGDAAVPGAQAQQQQQQQPDCPGGVCSVDAAVLQQIYKECADAIQADLQSVAAAQVPNSVGDTAAAASCQAAAAAAASPPQVHSIDLDVLMEFSSLEDPLDGVEPFDFVPAGPSDDFEVFMQATAW